MTIKKEENAPRDYTHQGIKDEEIERLRIITYEIYPLENYTPRRPDFDYALNLVKSHMAEDMEIRFEKTGEFTADLKFATSRKVEYLDKGLEEKLENLGFKCHLRVYRFIRSEEDFIKR